MTVPAAPRSPFPTAAVRIVVRHAGVIAALAIALLVPAKLLRVAHGDLPTALAVLNASDKTTIVTGLLLLSMPVLVAGCWAALVAVSAGELGVLRNTHTSPDRARQALAWLALLGLPAGVVVWLLLAVCPWPVAALTLGATVPLGWWEHRTRRRRRDGPPGRIARALTAEAPSAAAGLGVMAISCVLALLIADVVLSGPLNDTMWLPPEKLRRADGTVQVGYVLSRDSDTVVVLLDEDRRVERLAAADLRHEQLCRPALIGDGRSVWDISRQRPRSGLPQC